MKAVGTYLIITPKKDLAEKTKGGLILREKDREDIRYKQAVVESVGIEVKGVEIGDIICYDKIAGDQIEINKSMYTVIKESDVVIVL
jgi:co-chaperonin GroES (HSP10)